MKKILAWVSGLVVVAIIAIVALGAIFFKPIVKEQILAQLQNLGFEEAAIDDLSIGLYSSTIKGLRLDRTGQNKIDEITASYWPQQILNKRLNNITIVAPQLEIIIEANGGIIVSGYRIVSLDTETQIAQAGTVGNDATPVGATPAKNTGRTLPADLPVNSITIKDADFKLQTPSKKPIAGRTSIEIDTKTEAVKGTINIPTVDAAALLEMARVFKPDLVPALKSISGKTAIEANFNLASLSNFDNIPGQAIVKMEQLALTYNDMQATGVNGGLRFTHLNPPTLPKGQVIAVDRIQKGKITIQNTHTDFGLDKMRHLDVNHASLEVAGGIISAQPFKLDLQNMNSVVNLRILHVKLASLAELFGLQGFNIAGEFEGQIPLYINQSGVRIDQRDLLQATGATIDRMLPEATRQRIDQKLEKLGGTGAIINQTLGRQPTQQQPTAPQEAPAENTQQQQQQPQPTQQQRPAEQLLNDLLGGSGILRR